MIIRQQQQEQQQQSFARGQTYEIRLRNRVENLEMSNSPNNNGKIPLNLRQLQERFPLTYVNPG